MKDIVKRLMESRQSGKYYVIDNTMTDKDGDSEKYIANNMEAALQKKRELIELGSDEGKIDIVDIYTSTSIDED